MSSPVETLFKFEPAGDFRNWEPTDATKLKASVQSALERLPAASAETALVTFRYISDNRDYKLTDYLLLGVLSIFVHSMAVDHFGRVSMDDEIIEPAKPLPQVQISLSRPQPKPIAPPPPQVVKTKPPVPKAVPLKPQKPKPVAKTVKQAPPPAPTPIADNTPVATAPAPVAPPAPAPAPVAREKVTLPSAGAAYLHNPAPQYPEIAMDRGWEGKVLMKVHVQPDGHPDSISVIKSSGQKVLDEAAVKTVNKWSFVPAKRGETPIAGWVTVPISFNLS